jgi:hypothetical protein
VIGLLAGPFKKKVGEIWSGPRLPEYLTATDARRHLWHAWLASERVGYQLQSPLSAELAYRRLTFARGKHLLAEAYGSAPNGAMRALGRLGATARDPRVYQALVGVLAAGGGGAKFLRHSRELRDDVVLGLAKLPPGLPERFVLDMVRGRRVAADVFGLFAWTVRRLGELAGAETAEAILAAPNPVFAMWRAIEDLPFPAPPWPGDDRLRPIVSNAELRVVAKEFQNCLTDPRQQHLAVMAVLNGSRFYYEWQGDGGALLQCGRIGPVGWYVEEGKGRKNRDVPLATREDILRRLSQVPPFCPVWSSDWFEIQGFCEEVL